MTAARPQRKSPPALGPVFWLALGFAVCGGIFSAPATLAAPGDRIVVNDDTGLAISGFDPVAYFTDAKPKIGLPEQELQLDGAVWRFRNEGNRAAFAEHPELQLDLGLARRLVQDEQAVVLAHQVSGAPVEGVGAGAHALDRDGVEDPRMVELAVRAANEGG